MTKDEFTRKYLVKLRGLLVVGYATRHTPPSGLGMEYDAYEAEIERIVGDMVNDAVTLAVPVNGAFQKAVKA